MTRFCIVRRFSRGAVTVHPTMRSQLIETFSPTDRMLSVPDDAPSSGTPLLNWTNVAFGFSFILLDILLSVVLDMRLGGSLMIASIRCVLQLSLMGLVLQSVFNARNGWAVLGITVLLMCFGTFEVVVNKAKRRFSNMVPAVMASMIIGTVPASILGGRFAMGHRPFWDPELYIPTIGMLCGNAISAIVVATDAVLGELETKRDNIEVYLAFGATRLEACRPIAIEALRLALLPMINSMSVIGLISIPGMMTGALLGGSSVDQAARLQSTTFFLFSFFLRVLLGQWLYPISSYDHLCDCAVDKTS